MNKTTVFTIDRILIFQSTATLAGLAGNTESKLTVPRRYL